MANRKLHDSEHLKDFRKELRQSLTPAEAFLWKQLSSRKFHGRKFRRQHSIGNYIVDFYCAEEKLIIELDGDHHLNYTGAENDNERTSFLVAKGFNVIRFENKMIFDFLLSVLSEIKDSFIK